ncbi:hypothetical protein MRX96_006019 [Rhipicephalus microplus]
MRKGTPFDAWPKRSTRVLVATELCGSLCLPDHPGKKNRSSSLLQTTACVKGRPIRRLAEEDYKGSCGN